jgi:branched-chain amino acid aminotransferase
MLDSHGFVSTCNSTNFFIVKDKKIWTSTGEHCLNGVTRGAIIDLCRQNNIIVHEKNFGIEDVYSADEAFVTGTFAGVIPVIEIDGKNMSKGSKGLLTKQIQSWYTNDINNLT